MSTKPTPHILTTLPNSTIALPLAPPPHPALPTSLQPARHYLYIRPHTPKDSSTTEFTPPDHALYIGNIPIDSTPTHFRSLFSHSQLGSVRTSSVTFSDARPRKPRQNPAALLKGSKARKRKRGIDGEEGEGLEMGLPGTWDREVHVSGSSAVVEFVDGMSRERAWRAVKRLAKTAVHNPESLPLWSEAGVTFPTTSSSTGHSANTSAQPSPPPKARPKTAPRPLGSARYLAHSRLLYPSPETLQQKADEYMTAFSTLEARSAAKNAARRNQPDEDGFITVMKGGRTGPAREAEVEEMEERRKRRVEKGKERWGEGEFYRFQIREKRKAAEMATMQGFERERKRVRR